MRDLVDLNRRIARHALRENVAGTNERVEQYLEYLSVCVARLRPSVADIKKILFGVRPAHENTLADTHINRDYLNFCRLAGKDIEAGRYERLIELGLTVDQAEMIAGLSNEQITRLALCYPGAVAEFDAEPFLRGAGLHSCAGRFHASAYLTASV